MKNQDLENRFFYRLVKVVYYTFLFSFLSLMFYLGYSSIPKKYVDNDKSYLVCEKGLYPFNEVGIYFWNENNSENEVYSTKDSHQKAIKICSERNNSGEWEVVNSPPEPEIERAEKARIEFIKDDNHGPYTVSLEFKTEGSWKDAFEWWLVGSAMIYFILNIIKETLIYLAFGREFTWDWMKIIIINTRKIYDALNKA